MSSTGTKTILNIKQIVSFEPLKVKLSKIQRFPVKNEETKIERTQIYTGVEPNFQKMIVLCYYDMYVCMMECIPEVGGESDEREGSGGKRIDSNQGRRCSSRSSFGSRGPHTQQRMSHPLALLAMQASSPDPSLSSSPSPSPFPTWWGGGWWWWFSLSLKCLTNILFFFERILLKYSVNIKHWPGWSLGFQLHIVGIYRSSISHTLF